MLIDAIFLQAGRHCCSTKHVVQLQIVFSALILLLASRARPRPRPWGSRPQIGPKMVEVTGKVK